MKTAFVVTFSALSMVGCHKDNGGECKPPDCHMNPPPPPQAPDASASASAPPPTTSLLYSKSLNPRDPKTQKTIHATADGQCVIFPDPPKGTPPPTSVVAPTSAPIACPEAMKAAPFKDCAFGTVMALADETACVCSPVAGNPPPPPPTAVSCPKK